jgi:proteasome alpha subunit
MSIPFYVSPEQVMQDKAEYARKGIARGPVHRALEYDKGIALVAENPSSLSKIGEIYDRIAFAGVGKFSEFDQLRKLGIRFCDVRGYQYSREDVRARCARECLLASHRRRLHAADEAARGRGDRRRGGRSAFRRHEQNAMYRVQYDGTISDHHGYCGIGAPSSASKAI